MKVKFPNFLMECSNVNGQIYYYSIFIGEQENNFKRFEVGEKMASLVWYVTAPNDHKLFFHIKLNRPINRETKL